MFYFHKFKPLKASFGEWVTLDLLGGALNLDVLSIFIYSWSFLDVVLTDQNHTCRDILSFYKKISIFLTPTVSYAPYFNLGFIDALSKYDFIQ